MNEAKKKIGAAAAGHRHYGKMPVTALLVAALFVVAAGCSQSGRSGKNDAEAQYQQGKRSMAEKNYREAVRYFSAAAEQGHPWAQYELGECCREGKGTEPDSAQAEYWYGRAAQGWREAAERGEAKAQYELGRCCEYGYGVRKDEKKALYWYSEAAEQGDANAQYRLGHHYRLSPYSGTRYLYVSDFEVDQAIRNALPWYRAAAEQGHVEAQYELGECYERGKGKGDYKQAAIWYRKAA